MSVTSHSTISPKLMLSGKFGLLSFDLGGNTFPSDFPHFSFLFQLLGGTGMWLLCEKSPVTLGWLWTPDPQGETVLGRFPQGQETAHCQRDVSSSVSASLQLMEPTKCNQPLQDPRLLVGRYLGKRFGVFFSPRPPCLAWSTSSCQPNMYSVLPPREAERNGSMGLPIKISGNFILPDASW